MNNQKPEKVDYLATGNLLQVHSIFSTIQGEGPFTGEPAIFIRLAGCNLQCPLCDTDYTSERKRMSVAQILCEVLNQDYLYHPFTEKRGNNKPIVVITGGEPFRQSICRLIDELAKYKFRVQVETNGTLFQYLPYYNGSLSIVCSPKTGTINEALKPFIDSLKYVVKADNMDEEDGLPLTALDHPNSPRLAKPWADFEGFVYVQPADEKDEEKNQANLQAAITSAKKYGYRLGIQLHKFIGVE